MTRLGTTQTNEERLSGKTAAGSNKHRRTDDLRRLFFIVQQAKAPGRERAKTRRAIERAIIRQRVNYLSNLIADSPDNTVLIHKVYHPTPADFACGFRPLDAESLPIVASLAVPIGQYAINYHGNSLGESFEGIRQGIHTSTTHVVGSAFDHLANNAMLMEMYRKTIPGRFVLSTEKQEVTRDYYGHLTRFYHLSLYKNRVSPENAVLITRYSRLTQLVLDPAASRHPMAILYPCGIISHSMFRRLTRPRHEQLCLSAHQWDMLDAEIARWNQRAKKHPERILISPRFPLLDMVAWAVGRIAGTLPQVQSGIFQAVAEHVLAECQPRTPEGFRSVFRGQDL